MKTNATADGYALLIRNLPATARACSLHFSSVKRRRNALCASVQDLTHLRSKWSENCLQTHQRELDPLSTICHTTHERSGPGYARGRGQEPARTAAHPEIGAEWETPGTHLPAVPSAAPLLPSPGRTQLTDHAAQQPRVVPSKHKTSHACISASASLRLARALARRRQAHTRGGTRREGPKRSAERRLAATAREGGSHSGRRRSVFVVFTWRR